MDFFVEVATNDGGWNEARAEGTLLSVPAQDAVIKWFKLKLDVCVNDFRVDQLLTLKEVCIVLLILWVLFINRTLLSSTLK